MSPPSRMRGDVRGRALWVVLGCFVCQMGLGFGYLRAPLAPAILEDLGWARAALASASAPQVFVMAAVSPLVGAWCVRFGTRTVLSVAVVLLGLAFAGMSRMQELWQLFAFATLFGLAGAGFGDVSVGAVVARWVSRGRGLALGIVYTGSNLAGVILQPAGALLAETYSWRTAMLVAGVAGVVVLLPCAAGLVRDPRPGEGAAVGPGDPALGAGAGDLTLAEAIRTRSFWLLFFALFGFFFYFLSMLEHLILFLTDSGFSVVEAAGYSSTAIAMGLVSKVGFGWLADRMSHRRAILLDHGLLAASSGLLLFAREPGALGVFVVLYGFSAAARDVVYPLVIADCFGVRYLAPIYGALMLALLPGGSLGPIYTGWIHDRFGSYDAAFWTFAVLNVLSFAAVAGVRDETRALPGRPAPG